MAKSKKPKSSPKKVAPKSETNIWLVGFLVVFIVTAVWLVLSTTQASLEVKNDLQTKETQLLELKNSGINPESVAIRKVSLTNTFVVDKLTFDVRSAYLTPDIADFGDSRTGYEIGTKNKFLAVEVNANYTGTDGPKVDMMVNKYVSLRQANKAYKPVSADILRVGPNETFTAFVVFVVPMEAREFSLLAGPAGKTKVVPLNFAEKTVETLDGVFLLKDGYAASYPY